MAINFSIPNIPSLTKTTPDGSETIFVPDLKYLLKFSKGDLGIADSIKTSTIMNTVSRSNNKDVATSYLKSAGGVVDSPNKYVKNGKYIIPQSAITLDPSKNQAGLKALEKSIIQSIFDSQKPYMDMFSELSNVLIAAEDIIARVLALGDKSLKPATNPRALGYKQNGIVSSKNELAKLNSLTENTPDANNTSGNSNSNITNNNNIPNNQNWEIESIVYSTGDFKPNVKYTYEYIDEIQPNPIITGTNSEVNTSKLPQTLIVAIFDNNGNLISDDDINNNTYNLSWIKNSGKWFGSFNYLSSNDNDNLTLFTQYYKDYSEENAPINMSLSDKQNLTNKVNDYISSNNYQEINDQITSLKKDCFFSDTKFTNTNLLSTYDNTGNSQQISFNQAFAPKKMNINGTAIWIDVESEYDLKLIRCDSVYKSDDGDITNTNPYSTDVYGVDDNQQEQIGQIYRNQNSDTSNDEIFDANGNVLFHKTYFILEGIVSTNNNQSYDSINQSSNTNKFRYYRKKDFFGAIKVFIDLVILIASKLTPSINAISDIGSNPIKFVTDIMKSNLGDNNGTKDIKFSFFSSEFIKKFSSLKGSANKSSIIKNSILKNFVSLNKDGTYKFLLSGSGFSFLSNIKIGFGMDKNMISSTSSATYPATPTSNNLLNSNLSNTVNYNTLKFTSYKGGESIDYIGGYDPNKTYTYIYVTEYELGILKDAQNLENSGDLNGALDKYSEAQKIDPANKTITDKIDQLKKLISSFGGNSLFGFILNMITMPLQIVLGIIEQIIIIIKKFTSPKTLQSAISDLVAFKIFPGGLSPIDFFNPTNILKVAKISFNIDLFISWISSLSSKPLETYDLNKIIQLPFVSSFPKYTTKQFKSLVHGHSSKPTANMLPLKMLTGILKIFEGIINAIISFFWALMGIGGLLKKPILKFTKDSNTDISASDLQSLVNGTYTDIIDPNSTEQPNYNFIYNIQLPDGKTIRQLDQTELEQFIKDNSNFTYQYKL
jgi:hypothetical protein